MLSVSDFASILPLRAFHPHHTLHTLHTLQFQTEGFHVTATMPLPPSGIHLDLEALSGICGSDTFHHHIL